MKERINALELILLLVCFSAVLAGPCDIYASGGTPCIAAHSTVRALYNNYQGNLYQVERKSDSSHKDIPPLTAGGIANSTLQDDLLLPH